MRGALNPQLRVLPAEEVNLGLLSKQSLVVVKRKSSGRKA